MKRLLGPLLLVVLVAGVGYGIYRSVREVLTRRHVVAVRGLVGSEKVPYLTDPRVLAALRRHGYELRVDKAGSREMAGRADLKQYDFGFPAGAPAAVKLMQVTGARRSYTPFFTPMAVASWRPLVQLLAANGLARQAPDSTWQLDMRALLPVMRDGKRWQDLKGSAAYPVGKSVLISSTDVRTSNSAAMYLALASYVLNGDNVVQREADAAKVVPVAAGLFLRQGFQESSTAGPFDDYVTMGMGKAPLVMIYEAQFIQYQIEHPTAVREMVLLYPRPTVFTKHSLVPFNARGDSVGALLERDEELQHLAAEYGLRTNDPGYAAKLWAAKNVRVPAQLLDVIDPPSFEMLEQMITAIERSARAGADSGSGR
jgi:hypothetical protein